MITWIVMLSVGQASGAAPPPVNRRVPPPIPQPPASQPVPQPVLPPPVQPPAVEPPTDVAPTQPAARTITVRHAFLRQHDFNGDGRLSPGELERRFAKQFAFADLNGDGLLDAAEV